MEDDWDLHAVVRGCAATSTPAAPATSNTKSSYQTLNAQQQDCSFSTACFQDLFEPRRKSFVQEELHDLYKPFFPSSEITFSLPISPLSVFGGTRDPPSQQSPSPPPEIVNQLPQQTQLRPKQQSFSVCTGSKTSLTHAPTPRSKKRKSHTKRVSHVAAENLSSDVWSWRKYGQKPIKGSPYPRGYYRCSTSKGCMARKQVERNRSNPGMFIVTYTAEHNHPMPTHRNSLAGSTRQKPAEIATSVDSGKPSCSPELSPAVSLSPALEKMESSREDLAEAEDDDGELSVSKMALDDDFFAGLEDFTAGECTSDHFPAGLQLPWLSTIATTTAGGG